MSKLLYFLAGILLVSCGRNLPEPVQQEITSLPEKIDFNFHIKPLLSDRCYTCHGPDANKREADLRLDIAGYDNHSELIARILHDDPKIIMPPPHSNLTLSDKEKAMIVKWIDQGAEYKNHWAFKKPVKPDIPKVSSDWASNTIDNFILSKLQDQEIDPSEMASKEKLIRRAYFDITGLPPQLDDLDRWLSDKRADYYDHMIDYLLNQNSYGERMAAHWIDVARFADSEGYLDDFHHSFWPYRDWVIKAYNENLPYDKFLTWQLAGDLLEDPTQEQILATSFNRNHKQNSEGGIIPEEFRVDYVTDRTNTLGAAFMGLTLGCAKCHDHKYDPISQENYFELFSFFNSTVERGDAIFGYNAIENGQYIPHELSMNSGPVLALSNARVDSIKKFLDTEINRLSKDKAEKEKENTNKFSSWHASGDILNDFVKKIKSATITNLSFDNMKDGKASDLASNAKPPYYSGKISSVPGKNGNALMSDAVGKFVADGSRSQFERSEPFTISFWINLPKAYDEGHVIYNGNNRIQGYRGWDVVVDSTNVHFRLNHAHPYQSIDISTPQPIDKDEWVHFVWSYDGSSKASGMKLYQDGQEINAIINRDFVYRSTKPYLDKRASVYAHYSGLVIGNRHYDQDFTGGKLDDIVILNKEADPLAAKYLYNKSSALTLLSEYANSNPNKLKKFYDLFIDPELSSIRDELVKVNTAQVTTLDTLQEIMVMGDSEKKRQTYILERGIYDSYGDPVESDVPDYILPWKEDYPRNRLGLSQWLLDKDHPLTARVAVNQLWYLYFGNGLVESIEDFGNQGALPSHPELLDWLAIEYMESGWDMKKMITLMVTSSTYKQSAKYRSDLTEVDPNNHLLASSPRYRHSAEMVRDNILATSGLLNHNIGGPSVYPYQPGGLWKEVMTHPFFPEYEVDYDDGLYRRSIYTFWKRNMPPPSMLIFDASSRSECQVRRQSSNTPLQALVLLNDPQKIEGARILAQKMWTMTNGNIEQATRNTFRLLTSRLPTDKEQEILLEQFEEELAYFEGDNAKALAYLSTGHSLMDDRLPPNNIAALARVSNNIMNTTEAYFKN